MWFLLFNSLLYVALGGSVSFRTFENFFVKFYCFVDRRHICEDWLRVMVVLEMAGLVPGVILKLLENLNSDPQSIVSERKSSLLQIVGIIPALSGGDLFKNNGFYIKVSDSSHAVYASLPEEHEDLILSDKIQLGQFIHVDRLQYSSPFPLLCGVRPVPGRHPCVGTPLDLSSSEFVRKPNRVTMNNSESKISVSEKPDFNCKSEKMDSRKPLPIKLKSNISKSGLIFIDKKVSSVTTPRSIPSSPSSLHSLPNSFEKFSVGLSKHGKIKSKASPKPSSGATDKGIHVRVPSPNKSPIPPKKLPRCIEFDVKASRKSWEGMIDCRGRDSPKIRVSKHDLKSEARNSSVQRRNSSVSEKQQIKENKTQIPSAKSSSPEVNKICTTSKTIGGNKNCDSSLHLSTKKTVLSVKKSTGCMPNECSINNLVKVHPNKNGTHSGAISWSSLPSSLANLGKEVLKQKDAAQSAAIDAIQEASAAEALLQCLSIYSDLTSSVKAANPGHTIDQFLSLHTRLDHACVVTRTLSSVQSSDDDGPSEETVKLSLDRRKHATSWVRAALLSDLSPFTVFSNMPPAPDGTRSSSGQDTKVRHRHLSGPQGRREEVKNGVWVRGGGAGEGAELAETMGTEARDWFLTFIEEFLDTDLDPSTTTLRDSGEVAEMLSRLKNVNQWLGQVGCGDRVTSPLAETTDRLRKKIYGYLLTHVESAAAAAVGGGRK